MELKATEMRLLEAVSKVIEEEGFTKIGYNRIARQACCDGVDIHLFQWLGRIVSGLGKTI